MDWVDDPRLYRGSLNRAVPHGYIDLIRTRGSLSGSRASTPRVHEAPQAGDQDRRFAEPFTDEDVAALNELRSEGATRAELAEVMSCAATRIDELIAEGRMAPFRKGRRKTAR